MNIEIKMNQDFPLNICPYCFGSGKLKAMQSAMTYDAGSIRYSDTKIKCSHCNGTGIENSK